MIHGFNSLFPVHGLLHSNKSAALNRSWFMVFISTFDNISVYIIMAVSFYYWREPEYLEKITELPLSH